MNAKKIILYSILCAVALTSTDAAAYSSFISPPASNLYFSHSYPDWNFYKQHGKSTIPDTYDPIYNISESSVIPEVRLNGNMDGMNKYKEKTLSFDYSYKNSDLSCFASVSFQGNSSLCFDKKSYSVKLYSDKDLDIEKKITFGNWPNTENYLLKANWIDYTGARNIVASRLYKRMPNTKLPNGTYGIPDGFPVNLYINNTYKGIYTIVQPKKKKLFGLKDTDAVNGARLYTAEIKKGSVVFKNSSELDDYWECKFPADHYDKTALNRLTEFVSSCTYEEFKSYISNYMDIDSLINYLVFSEITMNADGWQKNYNIVTYDGRLWYIRPYDLDCTFGLDFAGDINPETYSDTMDDWINSTRLWTCVKACFPQEIYQRYKEVRNNQLNEDAIMKEFKSFMDNTGRTNYKAENSIWYRSESPEAYLKQINDYLKVRYECLDIYMKEKYDHPNYITEVPSMIID